MSKATIRNTIISLILLISAVAAFGLMLFQVSAQSEHLQEQITVLEEENAREKTYFKLQRTAEETVGDREKIRSYFLFQESDSIDFLNQIEGMAPDAGVVLKTNGLELVEEKESGSDWIEVMFTFSGSREKIQQFIKILEALPYVLRVTEVKMSARSSTEWSVDLTLRVRVLSYDE